MYNLLCMQLFAFKIVVSKKKVIKQQQHADTAVA